MPRGDGTGPKGQGKGTGGGKGMGQGGSRRQGGDLATRPDGYCVCPSCGEKAAHQRGTPCSDQQCPKCGTSMTRK